MSCTFEICKTCRWDAGTGRDHRTPFLTQEGGPAGGSNVSSGQFGLSKTRVPLSLLVKISLIPMNTALNLRVNHGKSSIFRHSKISWVKGCQGDCAPGTYPNFGCGVRVGVFRWLGRCFRQEARAGAWTAWTAWTRPKAIADIVEDGARNWPGPLWDWGCKHPSGRLHPWFSWQIEGKEGFCPLFADVCRCWQEELVAFCLTIMDAFGWWLRRRRIWQAAARQPLQREPGWALRLHVGVPRY